MDNGYERVPLKLNMFRESTIIIMWQTNSHGQSEYSNVVQPPLS